MEKNTKDLELKIRARAHLKSRMEDLRDMFNRIDSEDDQVREEAYTDFSEYALAFDYVAPNTFKGQKQGYFRYQISWGGPSEEIRYYCDENFTPYRIEFWFLDWFCGKGAKLHGKNLKLAERVWREFEECGTVEALYMREMSDEE